MVLTNLEYLFKLLIKEKGFESKKLTYSTICVFCKQIELLNKKLFGKEDIS